MKPLQVGESTTVVVQARSPWNDCGVGLSAENHYDFLVSAAQSWKDASIACDADGYSSQGSLKFFEPFRRVRSENWFKLIGVIEKSKSDPIVIGTGLRDFVASRSGPLYCFANDARLMYWNNHGSIQLTIVRKA